MCVDNGGDRSSAGEGVCVTLARCGASSKGRESAMVALAESDRWRVMHTCKPLKMRGGIKGRLVRRRVRRGRNERGWRHGVIHWWRKRRRGR